MIKALAVALFAMLPGVLAADSLRMAVTTSFNNSGLSDVLLPRISEDLGLRVDLLVVGTGQAIRLGQSGDVDAILVHSKTAEESFVSEGYGTHRTEIMYNDFVVIGPSDDPAGVEAATSATDALARIAAAGALFVSRGDDSGTHKKELSLWQKTEISTPQTDWYKEVGAGMGAALNTASGLNAYILSDRASWLKFSNKGDLALLYAGDPILFNQYSYLPVNPARHPHVKAELAAALEAWLTSDTAKALIDGYTLEGARLFTFNARQN